MYFLFCKTCFKYVLILWFAFHYIVYTCTGSCTKCSSTFCLLLHWQNHNMGKAKAAELMKVSRRTVKCWPMTALHSLTNQNLVFFSTWPCCLLVECLFLPVSLGEVWSSRCIRKTASVSLPAFLMLQWEVHRWCYDEIALPDSKWHLGLH